MTIEAAIGNLTTKLLAVPGMKQVPSGPIEDIGLFPFGVAYERSASTNGLAYGSADDLVTLWVEIHVSRVLLQEAIIQAMALRTPFLKSLIGDPTLGNTVSTVNDIRRTFGALKWGWVETIGYRFEIDVKVMLDL